MTFYKWVENEIMGYDVSKVRIFALSCIERVEPIVQELGADVTIKTFKEVTNQIRNAFNGEQVSPEYLREKLAGLPESEEEDAYKKGYLVMQALSILDQATYILNNTELLKNIVSICMSMLNLAMDIEGYLEDDDREETESFEVLEEEIQKRILFILKHNDNLDYNDKIQSQVNIYKNKLVSMISNIKKENGWES